MRKRRFWVMFSPVNLRNTILVLSLAAAAALAAGSAAASPMVFRLAASGQACAECRWISAEGEIVEDSASRLEKFLKAHPDAGGLIVRLHSGGGDLVASMEIGRVIRQRGLRTAVSHTIFEPVTAKDTLSARYAKGACASACTYAFLGGVERMIDETSRLGVHQFYSETPRGGRGSRGSFSVAQTAINDLGIYMAEMGVSGQLILAAAATAPVNMHWLSRGELESFQAVTDVLTPAEAPWSFAQAQGGLYLISRQQQKNGSVTEYRLSCSARSPRSIHLTAARVLRTGAESAPGDIRKQVRGAKLHTTSDRTSDLDFAGVAVDADTLKVAGDLDRGRFQRMIGENAAELYVNIDVPDDVAGAVGGASHRFPVTNLGKAIPLLMRNCS